MHRTVWPHASSFTPDFSAHSYFNFWQYVWQITKCEIGNRRCENCCRNFFLSQIISMCSNFHFASFYSTARCTHPRRMHVLLFQTRKADPGNSNASCSNDANDVNDEQLRPDARQLHAYSIGNSFFSADPFNLKEWKVSRQQVKRESNRRIEGTHKKDYQVRGHRERNEEEGR